MFSSSDVLQKERLLETKLMYHMRKQIEPTQTSVERGKRKQYRKTHRDAKTNTSEQSKAWD